MVQSRLVVARKNTCVIRRGIYIAARLEGLVPQVVRLFEYRRFRRQVLKQACLCLCAISSVGRAADS